MPRLTRLLDDGASMKPFTAVAVVLLGLALLTLRLRAFFAAGALIVGVLALAGFVAGRISPLGPLLRPPSRSSF